MLELQAEKRDMASKPETLRKSGKIPAVFYGRKHESTPVVVKESDFRKVMKEAGESTVVTLKSEGKDYPVLIHDVAHGPVHHNLLHVDFYVIEADKEVEVSVPLVFEGTAPAEKDLGGVLVKVAHEITIEALPMSLPHEIVVDLSLLKTMDDVIAIKDLKLPQGVTAIGEEDEVLVSMTEVKEEEEAPAEFDASAVEVEAKGKEDKEEGESEEGKE